MKFPVRIVLATLATGALIAGTNAGLVQGSTASSSRPGETRAASFVYTLDPSTHGNPEGVTWDPRSRSFFVGATGDGTIYRGKLGDKTVRPLITVDPSLRRAAVGMTTFRGKLYVAGGATSKIFVYKIRTGDLVGSFDTGSGGFLNDLTVTPKGDVYVTDSFRPTLWHLSPAQVRAGTGTPGSIDVSPEITYVTGQFNLNGIVWFRGGKELVVVNSFTGKLYRIVFDNGGSGGREISAIDAPLLVGGDGIMKDRGLLVVVVGDRPTLNFVKLTDGHSKGRIVKVRTDPTLRGPSTVARAKNRYLVVNADFATSTKPFTVASLPVEHHH